MPKIKTKWIKVTNPTVDLTTWINLDKVCAITEECKAHYACLFMGDSGDNGFAITTEDYNRIVKILETSERSELDYEFYPDDSGSFGQIL